MKVAKILLRWYKSFNLNYMGYIQHKDFAMSSLQRASHHEAGHVVYQWQGGGEVEWTAVGKQDGEWQGATHAAVPASRSRGTART